MAYSIQLHIDNDFVGISDRLVSLHKKKRYKASNLTFILKTHYKELNNRNALSTISYCLNVLYVFLIV